MLTPDRLAQLRRVAVILLPGDKQSPAAESLDDLDELLASAVRAVGIEGAALEAALATLPDVLTWDTLRSFAETHVVPFELISVVAAGAYFMSPAVLSSLGYPQGPRRATSVEQAVEELSTGILEPVMSRESMVREVTS